MTAPDWSRLVHAHGPATDVPQWLQALASPDAETRAAGFSALWDSVWHQGTRYPATPHVVTELVRLLDRPWPRDPARLLGLLTGCVAGFFSPAAGPYSASGTAWGQAFVPSGAPGERGYLDLLGDIEDRAGAAVPAALRLLVEGAPRTRAAAAWFLACLAGRPDAGPRRAALEQRLQGLETDEGVRATLAFALGQHLAPGESAALLALESDDSPLVLLVAALMLVRREGAQAPVQARDPLVAVLESPGDLDRPYRRLPWQSDGLVGEVAAVVSRGGPELLARVRPTLHSRLATAWGFDAVGLLEAALADAFGPDRAGAAPASDAQRSLVAALVANTALFSLGNVLTLLGERGLPTRREGLAAWAGVAAPADALGLALGKARAVDSGPEPTALAAWQHVLQLAPGLPEALCAVGRLLVGRGEAQAASEVLARACRAAPDLGEARFHLGHALALQEQSEEALAAFLAAEAGLDDPAPARRNRVAMLQRLGRFAEAAELLLTELPEDGEGWFERSLALVKAGRLPEAVTAGNRAVQELPDHGGAQYTLACAHALLGDVEAGLRHVEAALRAAPGLAAEMRDDPDLACLRADPRFARLLPG